MPQALADELGRIPLSRSLAASIVRAKDHAGAKGHRLVTLEHLLLALAEDEEAALVLAACNVDLGRLGAEVAAHLARLEREPPGGPGQPPIAPELKRMIEYAAAAAQQGRRSQVDGAIVLAAMVGEGRSMAAGFLRAQALTFEAIVHALQQQAQERAIAAQQNGAIPPSTEEILASARERIAAAGRGQAGRAPPAAVQRAGGPPAERPLAARPGSILADRAQPPPPVFAETDNHSAKSAQAGASASDKTDLAGAAQVQAELPPGRTPPPLPLSPARDEETSGQPHGVEPETSPQQAHPPLPEWMATRQVAPQSERPGGPPPPPLRGNDAAHRPAAGAHPDERSVPTLEAPPRRPAPAPARPPRFDRKPAVEPGQLVENIPRRMRVGVTETVEVRVGRAEADLSGNLQGSGTPTRHDVYITKAISVRLRAPGGGFRIDAASPETQWTEATMGPLSSDFAVWRFSVTPDRRGEAVLQLVVAARVLGRDGIMAETALPERVIAVRVRTNYVRTTLRASGWLAALAVAGVVGRVGEDALALALKLIASVGAGG